MENRPFKDMPQAELKAEHARLKALKAWRAIRPYERELDIRGTAKWRQADVFGADNPF